MLKNRLEKVNVAWGNSFTIQPCAGLEAAGCHCEESMLRLASRLSIKMTGKRPVPRAIPQAVRLLRSARNDMT